MQVCDVTSFHVWLHLELSEIIDLLVSRHWQISQELHLLVYWESKGADFIEQLHFSYRCDIDLCLCTPALDDVQNRRHMNRRRWASGM